MIDRRLKLSLLSLGLFSLLGVLAVGITELVLRQRAVSASEEKRDHVESTDYLPVRFRPNYSGEFWGIPFTTNRYGFRDEPDFPARRPADEFRVLSLGDSIGFGLGVEAQQHYTQVAQQILSAAAGATTVRIVNAGGQGYSPSGYFVYLQQEGMQVEPSCLVVEIELCNDISDEAFLEWVDVDGDRLPEKIRGGRYQLSWDGNLLGTYPTGWELIDRSYLGTIAVRRALNLLNRFGNPEPVPESAIYYSLGFDRIMLTETRVEQGWARAFGAIRGMHDLARDYGIPFLLMIMPSRYMFEETVPYSEWAVSLYERALLNAEVGEIPFIGLREALGAAGGARLFFDFAHLTEEGNRVVGEELARALREARAIPEAAGIKASLRARRAAFGLE